MRVSTIATAAALAGSALAQRPSNTSICDYYTTALLKNNTAENQLTVLTLLVNTVVIGNYTKPTIPGITFPDIKVPGILAPGKYMDKDVDLLPYFNGKLASSNRGGKTGVSVNFLDDGGAAPLMENKPANGTSSAQYRLLTHLYQFFGSLLQCSQQGMGSFAAYNGDKSMYDAHKFMALDASEVGYFITQVGLAASSFGVAKEDVEAVGKALNMLFGYKCAPETTVIKAQGPALQSICIAEDCPTAENATCSAYETVVEPMAVNGTTGGSGSGSNGTSTAPSTPSSTGASPSATSPIATGAAAANAAAGITVAGGLAALAFFL